MALNNLDKVLGALRPGETVLVEYSAASLPEVLLYLVWSFNCRDGIIVDDVADTLCGTIKRLEVLGVDVSFLKKAPVIKIGGGNEYCGNVAGTVDLDRYYLDVSHYNAIFNSLGLEGVAINPVLGLHKLLVSIERRNALRILGNISSFEGNRKRIAFYFVNRDAIEGVHPEVLALLEEIATTVIRWDFDSGKFRLRVLKAASLDIMGEELSFAPKNILSI
jgi:hypothetical protein